MSPYSGADGTDDLPNVTYERDESWHADPVEPVDIPDTIPQTFSAEELAKVFPSGMAWAYVNGVFSHSNHVSDAVYQAADRAGLDDMEANRLANLVGRNQVPSTPDVAFGIIQAGRPVIWHSTIDKNRIMDELVPYLNEAARHRLYEREEADDPQLDAVKIPEPPRPPRQGRPYASSHRFQIGDRVHVVGEGPTKRGDEGEIVAFVSDGYRVKMLSGEYAGFNMLVGDNLLAAPGEMAPDAPPASAQGWEQVTDTPEQQEGLVRHAAEPHDKWNDLVTQYEAGDRVDVYDRTYQRMVPNCTVVSSEPNVKWNANSDWKPEVMWLVHGAPNAGNKEAWVHASLIQPAQYGQVPDDITNLHGTDTPQQKTDMVTNANFGVSDDGKPQWTGEGELARCSMCGRDGVRDPRYSACEDCELQAVGAPDAPPHHEQGWKQVGDSPADQRSLVTNASWTKAGAPMEPGEGHDAYEDPEWDTLEVERWIDNEESWSNEALEMAEYEDYQGFLNWINHEVVPSLKGQGVEIDRRSVDEDYLWQQKVKEVAENAEYAQNAPTEQERLDAILAPVKGDPDADPSQWQAGDIVQDSRGSQSMVMAPLSLDNGAYLKMRHIAPGEKHDAQEYSLHPSAIINTYGYRCVPSETPDAPPEQWQVRTDTDTPEQQRGLINNASWTKESLSVSYHDLEPMWHDFVDHRGSTDLPDWLAYVSEAGYAIPQSELVQFHQWILNQVPAELHAAGWERSQ